MPYSDGQGKEAARDWYQRINPRTVIDIGVGCGTYAKLVREPVEERKPKQGRRKGAKWVGVEAWEPYVEEFALHDWYDDLLIEDARTLEPGTFKVDLVIAGDVLEHMTQAEASALIARIQRHAANLIVSIPVLHLDQGAVNGNPFERHVDHWTYDQMRTTLGTGVREVWRGDVLAYFWWQKG